MSRPTTHPVIGGRKYCMECFDTKSVSEYLINNKKNMTLKPICDTCESRRVARARALKRMEKRPELYLECDECCHIWYATIRKECPKCEWR